MKFSDFWLEVPTAFFNLLNNNEFLNSDVIKYQSLLKVHKVFIS